MATLVQEQALKDLGHKIKRQLKKAYGTDMGFFLLVTPFNEKPGQVADYISNVRREDGVATLRDTADRLERAQTIPAAKGGVQ